jgi:hypothetical protein
MDLYIFRNSHYLHDIPFRELDLFPSPNEGRKTPTPLDLLEMAPEIEVSSF